MGRPRKNRWTLAELARESGIAPRTIRYYISRGLLDGPAVAGRGAAYGAAHLERLRAIQRMQAGGAMLAEIAQAVAGGAGEGELPEPERWARYPLQDDVVVWVRDGAPPWRVRRIRRALAEFAAKIDREKDNATDGDQ